MYKKFFALPILFLLAFTSPQFAAVFLPNVPTEKHAAFSAIKEEIENRWRSFQEGRVFTPFVKGKSDEVLKEEFSKICAIRKSVWETTGYELAEHLIKGDLVRAKGCVAFAYNNTTPYYNASTLCLSENYYIACEGPRGKDISGFFTLLMSYGVTHLVRLTDAYEGFNPKCYPYWEGILSKATDGKSYLHIPTQSGVYPVSSFNMSFWKDNQGVDPTQLLSLVLQVREDVKKTDGLLAVHCSAGVGRTGTFLAALAIVDAIEAGKPFSIEEIVYRLSLQRVKTVAKPAQYITLHRLAEKYLSESVL